MLGKDILSYNFSKRLTQRARHALGESLRLAREHPQKGRVDEVHIAHLFFALLQEEGSIARNILLSQGVKKIQVRSHLKKNKAQKTRSSASRSQGRKATQEEQKISSLYKKVLKKATNHAMKNGQHFIGTEHLLVGVLDQTQELKFLSAAQLRNIREQLDEIILSSISIDSLSSEMERDSSHALFSLGGENFESHGTHASSHKRSSDQDSKHSSKKKEGQHADEKISEAFEIHTKTKTPPTPILETFCENLSQKAMGGELDPVVGRDAELQRLIQILLRKNKSNPLLIGDPGVGKTAIIHGLAQAIVAGSVPQNLLNKNIFSLNLSALIAGTMFRGEFEERMHDLVEEASRDDVILFIDEVHTLMGAGSAQGSLDAANIIKPALVKGAFQCIGATTHEEYKKSIEKDGALDRRFQKLLIAEETPQDALMTLARLKPTYEAHHGVAISAHIIKLCVDLSVRYLPARALPDKAIDILDESASKTRTNTRADERDVRLQKLARQRAQTIKQKEEALAHEEYKKALLLKNRQELIERTANRIKSEHAPRHKVKKVTPETIYQVVADMTSIPISALARGDGRDTQHLESTLEKHIIGQPHAIKKIVQALRRNHTGIRKAQRPIGSYLFMGPSGVGKTSLAQVLASALAGREVSETRPATLIKLDMSELSEAHTVARLIGAPPGYVGYEEAGFLTDKIKRTPHSVVLFDEIEKAHPKVMNTLLQILEDGALTDAQGRTANFKNALIILTSNIAADDWNKNTALGFDTHKRHKEINREAALALLKDTMRPEIINRLDDIIIFEHLNTASLQTIARNQLKTLQEHITETIKLEYSPSVPLWVVRKAGSQESGARAIRKIIEQHIEEKIAEEVVKKNPKKITIGVKNNTLSFVTSK